MKAKNILKFIATGSVSLILAACYGVQTDLDNPENKINRRGKIRVVTPDGSAIKGLKITYNESYSSVTDENGESSYELETNQYEDLRAAITDTDGPLNGTYSPRTIDIDDDDKTADIITLTEP